MTAGYTNSLDFTQVVQVDQRNPYISWRNHRARGSAGGVDLVAQSPVRLFAPADCVITNRWGGTGGNTLVMSFADGWKDEFMHLSAFAPSGPVARHGLVGWSGRSGARSTPYHIHWHRIDPSGIRRNPWDYFDKVPQPGTPAVWQFNIPSPSVQLQIQAALKRRKRYSGGVDGKWGKFSIIGIQKTIYNVGYRGKFDGVPGPSTCYYVQVYAKKFGGYKGPLDRVLGPVTWAAFARGVA